MDWGTRQSVYSEAEANGALERLKQSLPEVESAYVPSGKVPAAGLAALFVGAGIGAPLGGIASVILGAITVALLVLLGLVIAVVAACGWVVCITVIVEIAIVIIGGGLTFAAAGFVPGWVTAHAGMYGKNRNPTVAAVISLPSTLAAFAMLALTPQLLSTMVDPPALADDLSFASLVHLLDGTSWIHIGVWLVGLVIALVASWLAARHEVGAQKFCEACDAHMDEVPIHPMSFEMAGWAFTEVQGGRAANVAQHVTQASGYDVEPNVYECPSCHAGFFEARAHFFAEWMGTKETEEMRRDWLCCSLATAPDQTVALAQCRRHEDAV